MAGNLKRYTPFSNMARFDPFRGFDDLFSDFPMAPAWSRSQEMDSLIKMDISESDTDYRVSAEMPGVRKEDIKIDIDGGTVTIRAEVKQEREEKQGENTVRSERFYGQQFRSFTVPQAIDESQVQAKYQDGILTLTIPKKSGGSAKQVTVQ
ncbi:MAG: Hsp20/alpha crystallin family protein [Noviherbaspirillum sp.]